MRDDEDDTDEVMLEAMAVLGGRSEATNEFFIRVGGEILTFAQKNDLTVKELTVSLGNLAGAFSIIAIRSNPERYVEAIADYVDLCVAGINIGSARSRIMHEEATPKQPRARRNRGGPTNG
jgi:hypothetical protein